MSDEDLEVLITLDDPWYGPDDDVFHQLQPDADWPAQQFLFDERRRITT